jgi:hypothetical protein
MKLWCGFVYGLVVGPLFLTENAIKGNTRLDMLELLAFPQMKDIKNEKGTAVVFH